MSMKTKIEILKKRQATLFGAMMTLVAVLFVLSAAASAAAGSGVNAEEIKVQRFSTQEHATMNHFVAAVDDQLFIAVAVSEVDTSPEKPTELVVYLCDGRSISQWLVERDFSQRATLADAQISVELALGDAGISGTVTLADEAPKTFLAEEATDSAGLYRAEWVLADAHYMINWIILPDGRQRGSLDGKGNDIMIMVPWARP